MSQQINLFNPIFLKQKKYFSAVTMVQALGLILLGCGLLVAYAEWSLSNRTRDAAATSAQLLKTKGQLISITAQFAPHQNNQALDNDIKKVEVEIKSEQQVFDILKNGEFGDTKGYSSYFRGFARQIIDGLWLTDIHIDGAGHAMRLKGRAMNPELIPAYLERLKREADMKGKSFVALDMKVPTEEKTSDKTSDKANGADSNASPMKVLAPYIEFDLRSSNTAETASGEKSK